MRHRAPKASLTMYATHNMTTQEVLSSLTAKQLHEAYFLDH